MHSPGLNQPTDDTTRYKAVKTTLPALEPVRAAAPLPLWLPGDAGVAARGDVAQLVLAVTCGVQAGYYSAMMYYLVTSEAPGRLLPVRVATHAVVTEPPQPGHGLCGVHDYDESLTSLSAPRRTTPQSRASPRADTGPRTGSCWPCLGSPHPHPATFLLLLFSNKFHYLL